jgi:peptide/nickel transport system substrate-binding protein
MAALIVLPLLLAACSSGSSSASTKNTLTLVQSIAPTSMNTNIDKIRANVRVQNQIIEAAIEYKYEGGNYKLNPTLVTAWKQSAPSEWTFNVRPNVEFSNGEKLTADAFQFSLNAILTYPGGKLAAFFKGWKIEVIDAMTFKVISPNPNDSTVPGGMTQFFIFPPKYYAAVGAVQYGQQPIGTGPYILTQFKQGSEVDLVANGNYWGQKASIKNVKILGVPDDSTRVSMLLSGQADIAESVPQPLISRVSQSANYEIRAIPTASTFYLMFNMNLPPFNDVRVRQALNYSIDRSSLVGNLFKQTAEASYQWYVPAYPGFDKAYDPYPYNPGKARALLAQAGYPNGVDAAFYFPIGNGPMDLQSAEALQAQLQQVGFRVSMHGGDPNSVRNAFTLGNESGVLINNYAPPSLDVALLFAYYLTPGSNYSKTAVSPAAVALVQQAVTTADLATREKLYNQAQDIFLGEQSLFAPLWTQVDTWGVAKDVVFNPEPLQAYYMNQMSFK